LAGARKAAGELIAAGADFDRLCSEAAAALTRRDRLRDQLAASGCLGASLVSNLGMPSRVRRAFAVHLGHYLAEHIPVSYRTPLATSDAAIARSLRRPQQEETAA
jgi:hypothetical protein